MFAKIVPLRKPHAKVQGSGSILSTINIKVTVILISLSPTPLFKSWMKGTVEVGKLTPNFNDTLFEFDDIYIYI